MFQRDCLDTCSFEYCIGYACVSYFCICPCSAQLSMFHMEKSSRNTRIIIIIIIIIIKLSYSVVLVTVWRVIYSNQSFCSNSPLLSACHM